jgi:lysozyme
MNVNPDYKKLAAIKKHFEGLYLNAYQDSGGVWTIGFGSTYNYDKGRKVQKGDFLTEYDAIRYMERETENVRKQLNFYIKRPLNLDQSAAIMDYVYNRGIGNFLKTRLDELINENPNDPAIAKEIIGTGLRDRAGNLLWGLGRRRRAEAHLYTTGALKFVWPKWG